MSRGSFCDPDESAYEHITVSTIDDGEWWWRRRRRRRWWWCNSSMGVQRLTEASLIKHATSK